MSHWALQHPEAGHESEAAESEAEGKLLRTEGEGWESDEEPEQEEEGGKEEGGYEEAESLSVGQAEEDWGGRVL